MERGCLTSPILTISPLPEFILTGVIFDFRDLLDSPLFSPGGKCGSGACFYLIIRGRLLRFYPLSLLP